MAAVSIESLEARFSELQRKIFGNKPDTSIDEYERMITVGSKPKSASSCSVTDLLINSTSYMSTALSGRENINTIIPRMEELDRYLDPTYEDSLDTSALVEVLLQVSPVILQQCEQLEKLNRLAPVLDSENINNVPSHGKRLEKLSTTCLELRDSTDDSLGRVYDLLEEYNAIMGNVTKTLVRWDDLVTRIELESKPKRAIE